MKEKVHKPVKNKFRYILLIKLIYYETVKIGIP